MHPKYIVYNPLFKTIWSRVQFHLSLFLFSLLRLTTIEIERSTTGIQQQNVFYIISILLVSYTINPIEVKGRIAILIAYRGDSVFISRLVIMRTGRFCVDAAVYRFMHPSLQAPAMHFFPGFKMILVAFFIDYFRKEREAEAVKRDASFIFGTLLLHFRCEIVPSSIKSNPVDQDSSKKREDGKEK